MSTPAEEVNGLRSSSRDRLRFRRQFFLGPEFVEDLPDWTRLEIDGTARLTVHPDLEALRATAGNKSIVLLGYILDPRHPQAGNADIVHGLLERLGDAESVIEATCGLGGRWVLVVNDGRKTILFHDAAGLRQVYFTEGEYAGPLRCASQPGLIARALGLQMDGEALAFMAARGGDDAEVYWMPGDTSMYAGIKLLLPNHHLDLATGIARRYWPRSEPADPACADPVVESATLMRGLMDGASRRYPLALSLTAGWDSRLMLALSKEVARDLYCFTLTYPNLPTDARDVTVPALLLGKLGLRHEVLGTPEVPDQAFKDLHRENVACAKEAYCGDAQAMYESFPPGRVCITGDVAEIVKCFYRLPARRRRKVCAGDLAALARMGDHAFALRAFEEWLAGAETHGVDLLDLFCWEQMAGRWQALIRSEYDMVQECFAPLNCRRLLALMLSVAEERRRPPHYPFFRELIAHLWSDVLSVPINPPERIRVRTVIAHALRSMHLYNLIPARVRGLGRREWK